MDPSYVAQNAVSRERLRTIVANLAQEQLTRSIGFGWTVAAALAHLAYWDRRSLSNLQRYVREGVVITPVDPDPINDAMLPEWLAMAPEEAVRDALAAAEAVDQKIAGLSAESQVVKDLLAQRPRTLARAMHRDEHLDQIARALGR